MHNTAAVLGAEPVGNDGTMLKDEGYLSANRCPLLNALTSRLQC
jgi:hypothetical protein